MRLRPPPETVPGTLEHTLKGMEWSRTLPNVPEWKSVARQEVDRVWSRLASECTERFGRAPSVDVANQPDAGAVCALEAARTREARYLDLSAAPHAGAESLKAAFSAFVAAVATWVNRVTADWPSAKQRAAQARAERRPGDDLRRLSPAQGNERDRGKV